MIQYTAMNQEINLKMMIFKFNKKRAALIKNLIMHKN
jgi:hypothetical protein